jgi:hypothetical protein
MNIACIEKRMVLHFLQFEVSCVVNIRTVYYYYYLFSMIDLNQFIEALDQLRNIVMFLPIKWAHTVLYSCYLMHCLFSDNRMTISLLGNLDEGSTVRCLKPLTLQTMRSVW